MRLRTWLRVVSGILMVGAASYTALVLTVAPDEAWSWGHQLVATLIAAGAAVVIGFWLYRAQLKDRKRDLWLLITVQIVDIRDVLDESEAETTVLPDGSTEELVLTYLHSSIFDEALRSGLFGPEISVMLSRAIGIIEVYNLHATNYETMSDNIADDEFAEQRADQIRATIWAIKSAREEVLKAMDNIFNEIPTRELNEAFEEHDKRSDERGPKMGSASEDS